MASDTRIGRRLALVAINVIVLVVFAEAVALLIYYEQTGRLFYSYRKPLATIDEIPADALTADVLHPYFGPIHRPGVRPETNNIGFGSPHAYPFARTSDRQLLVGIFGGSVARQFCDRGTARLAARLQNNGVFAGRELVPLCFGHEGYKQPQQMLVLAYFLSRGQALDLVINIDGFNEVALGTYNNDRGRDMSMPSPLHIDPLINVIDRSTMTPAMIESLAAISRYRERLRDLAARLQANGVASVNFVLEQLYARTLNQYRSEVMRYGELPPNSPEASFVLLTPALQPRSASTLYDDIAAQWATASLLMNDMLAARSVPYVHVLQPNQYFTQRKFGEEEARIALNASTPFKPSVEQGYPALVRASDRLKDRERFFDATALFDREAEAVYEDDCCHYTQRGNDLLADFVAARILETLPASHTSVAR